MSGVAPGDLIPGSGEEKPATIAPPSDSTREDPLPDISPPEPSVSNEVQNSTATQQQPLTQAQQTTKELGFEQVAPSGAAPSGGEFSAPSGGGSGGGSSGGGGFGIE